MAYDTFDGYYPTDPWTGLTENSRTWYDPILLETWKAKAIWAQYVPMKVAISETTTMHFDMMFELEPNIDPIGLRQLWIDAMRTDSQSLELTTEHHAGKTALHKYDSYINRWRKSGGQGGLEPIVRDLLAGSMVDHFDKLARNAFLSLPFRTVAMRNVSGANPNFGSLTESDMYDYTWADNAQLRAMTMNLPGFDGDRGSIVAITTPGAIFHARKDPNFISLMKYSDVGMTRIVNGEIGSLYGVRYVPTPSNILWNCGTITKQVAIKVAVNAGDGGHSWANLTVGQVGNAGMKNYLSVENFTAGQIAIDDVVTVHLTRTNDFGVTNGVDYRSGMVFNRVVKYVDTTGGACKVGFDRPIFWDFKTDLGGTVYGYVTKGLHVHATSYICGPGAVVAGVTQTPQMHIPPVVDDLEALHRFTWDAYVKYQPFRVEFGENVFHAGEHRISGATSTGA